MNQFSLQSTLKCSSLTKQQQIVLVHHFLLIQIIACVNLLCSIKVDNHLVIRKIEKKRKNEKLYLRQSNHKENKKILENL